MALPFHVQVRVHAHLKTEIKVLMDHVSAVMTRKNVR